MTHAPSLLCIGLTTVDVVALPVRLEPFDGVRLIDAVQMAPAGTAAGTALVAAKLRVATQLAGRGGPAPAARSLPAEPTLGRGRSAPPPPSPWPPSPPPPTPP